MTDITKIVNVEITRDDQSISKEGFGIILGLAPHVSWTDLTRSYSNLNEIGEDFADDTKVFLWAEKVFSQEPRTPELKVGRRQVDSVDTEITTVENNTEYKTTINNVAFPFTSDVDATDLEIAAGLVDAINLGSEPVTATDNIDGTYTLDADVAGAPFSVTVDGNQTIDRAFVPTNDIVTDVQAIQANDDDWYVIDEFELTEQAELAAYIETQEKLYAVFTADANVVDQNKATDTTSIAALLNTADYDRSFVMYTGKSDPVVLTDPNSKYIEGAWAGKMLPTDPGSATWANKTLKGIPADNLTGNQYDNALSKKANVYTTFAGLALTRNGNVASGEYIDVIRGIDWFTARLRERLLRLEAESPKVPYTDHGIQLVESQVRAQIQDGIGVGLIDSDKNTYYVTVPKALDVSAQDRLDRVLKDVQFQWRASGAIHKLDVKGRVTF